MPLKNSTSAIFCQVAPLAWHCSFAQALEKVLSIDKVCGGFHAIDHHQSIATAADYALPSFRRIGGIMCGTQDINMGVKDASEQILESQAIAEST